MWETKSWKNKIPPTLKNFSVYLGKEEDITEKSFDSSLQLRYVTWEPVYNTVSKNFYFGSSEVWVGDKRNILGNVWKKEAVTHTLI